MSFWTAIVVIVAIIAFASVRISHHNRVDHRSARADADNDSDGDKRAMRGEIEQLHDRIKVLERIATEGNSLDARETQRISAEIDALREKQAD